MKLLLVISKISIPKLQHNLNSVFLTRSKSDPTFGCRLIESERHVISVARHLLLRIQISISFMRKQTQTFRHEITLTRNRSCIVSIFW